MGLCEEVRMSCAAIAAEARSVTIDLERLGEVLPGPAPVLDSERHYLEGSREDVATYLLTLGTINFGSGWFPTMRKRPGCSGYYTVAWSLADRFRSEDPWSPAELRRLDAAAVAAVLEQNQRQREIRACALHACELIAAQMGVPARVLDTWLWSRGQEAGYKAVPRHRSRCVWY